MNVYRQVKERTLYEELSLLHPDHLASLVLPEHLSRECIQRKLQGPRSFVSNLCSVNKCGSKLLWNYECPLSGNIQQDHLFPHSLGGPTVPTNRIHLCRYHNMVKTCDIHCFPWEEADKWCKPWLGMQISKLRREFELYG